MSTHIKAVLDASVFARAAVEESESAREWTQRLGRDVRAHEPELLWPELVSTLLKYVQSGVITLRDAHNALAQLQKLPLDVHTTATLASPAMDAAVAHGIWAYDATYLVLAQALDATLVTADRRLARVATNAELIA